MSPFKYEWGLLYEQDCFNPVDKVFDVRNGILMRKDLHAMFDMYLFTIVLNAGEYRVRVSDLDKRVSAELRAHHDTAIAFKVNENQWPGATFLKKHNADFNSRQLELKAAAEARDLKKSESGDTFTNDDSEEVGHFSKLADEMWEESQFTSTFLNLE
ncbi:hypothetical protein BC830DRAFT_1159955 [Chytriomyces sp. MP71]|nr:hypothetical protein BC830DRAFT_1159955 [Chytriomyces sp. MP71]